LVDPTSHMLEEVPPESPDLLIGRMLAGKYKLEKKLGEGGMGAVYKARQIALEKTIAVKVMHKELASDPMFAARFHREAKAASRLDHANSIDIHDFGEEPDGLLYIAMEFLDGSDLLAIVERDGPLPAWRIVDILSQALSALAVAHDMGIIHRDLKPENIMVLRRKGEDDKVHDVVKVCDFGIAKVAEGPDAPESAPPTKAMKGKLTTAGLVIGTPEYMSPEQGRGEALDARCDLYSMGVILYLLLSGQTPFDAPTPLGIVLKHQNEEPLPPSRVRAMADLRLEAVCLKAMSKRPQDRYSSAREMRAALRTAVDGTVSHPAVPIIPPTQLSNVAHARTEILAGEQVQLATEVMASRDKVAFASGQTEAFVPPSMGSAAPDPGIVRAVSAPLAAEAGAAARPPSRAALKAAIAAAAVALIGGGGFLGWTFIHSEETPQAPTAAANTAKPPPVPPRSSVAQEHPAPPPVTPAPSHEAPTQPSVPSQTLKQKNSSPSVGSKLVGEAVPVAPPPAPEPPAEVAPPPVAPSPPHALPPEAPAAPPFDPNGVKVDMGSVNLMGGGATTRAVTGVVSSALPKIRECYRGSATASGPEGTYNLKITTDDDGNVIDGRLDGPMPEQAKACIKKTLLRSSIKGDTGAVVATVQLTFKLR
jgi:eukaryotic-like serine/threonine-protein kinase